MFDLSRRAGTVGPGRLQLTAFSKRVLAALLLIAPTVASCEPRFDLSPVARSLEAAKQADACRQAKATACDARLAAVGALYVELPDYPMALEPQCVATLVSPNTILTAAHCVPAAGVRIVFQLAGTLETATVERSINYGASTVSGGEQTDDIALAFLDRSFAVKPLSVDFATLKPECGGLYVLSTRGAKPVCASATRGAGFEDRFDIVGAPIFDEQTGLMTFICHGDSGALVMQAAGSTADPTTDRALGIVAGGFELDQEFASGSLPHGACSGFAVVRRLQPYQSWIVAKGSQP